MTVRNHVKDGAQVPKVNRIQRYSGCLIAALEIARAPSGLPVSRFRPEVLAVLERERFIVVRASMAIVTGSGRDVMVAYDRAGRIDARKQAIAVDVSSMVHSATAEHALPEVKGRHAGRSGHLAKCWDCGAEASTPCRNMDNEITIQSCPGRRPIFDRGSK